MHYQPKLLLLVVIMIIISGSDVIINFSCITWTRAAAVVLEHPVQKAMFPMR